jgi:hypothetical protein
MGTHCNIYIDHNNLEYIFTQAVTSRVYTQNVTVAEPTWITPAQVRKSSLKGSNRTSNGVTPWPVG